MVRPAPIPSDPARSCSAPCRLPSPPRQCPHNLQQTPPPPRPDDGPARRETELPGKIAPGWVQLDHHHNIWSDEMVVNPYFTLSKADSVISGQVLSRIFEAHRLMTELRAAQKLNAGLLESDGSVSVSANDI